MKQRVTMMAKITGRSLPVKAIFDISPEYGEKVESFNIQFEELQK
jgi:hypothetical protein